MRQSTGLGAKWLGLLVAALAAAVMASCGPQASWKTASRAPAGIAPLPADEPDAVVQVYAARLWGMRGLVADHTWVATKRRDASTYTVYEVIGWLKWRGNKVLRIAQDHPDRHWYGNPPRVLFELRGDAAEAAVDKVHEAALSYPYPTEYKAFPGPNSNTFTQWVISHVPELDMSLPLRAVGKSYVGPAQIPSEDGQPESVNLGAGERTSSGG